MASVFNFEVTNEDLSVRFSCPNHERRIAETIRNLCIDTDEQDSAAKLLCRYTSEAQNVKFSFDGNVQEENDIRHEAVFFENTEYPLIVRGKGKDLEELSLAINDHLRTDGKDKSTIISTGDELYGSLNFHNQVGMTDFCITYRVKGEEQTKKLKFMTEVLSYKLDYRSDLKTIISDIEHEYAMLSTSFLKDTYLSMRQGTGENNPLIWWQIFKSCYADIMTAARQIIDRPKRRLRSVAKYERAERMAYIPRELENEYQTHKDNPAHLYRTEELTLSHDTIENRFLKYAIREMTRRFAVVKEHIMTAMHLDDPKRIDTSLEDMENELMQLSNNAFFRGVGQFKGFTQDNLVMKQAQGYKTIMEKWVELQQGYELEEGMRKLEVKDICDLYEIWCFIKVKNIVQDVMKELGKDAKPKVNGRDITNDFIPQLVYGGSVSFINQSGIELASVCYNAEVHKGKSNSAISGTNTMTTVQRPDIVLRLSKHTEGNMKFTYLFDAKYRIADTDENGSRYDSRYDVPPADAIDQMHRYRDAIYYTEEGRDHEHLKKEIIAGYVLFPGRIPLEALDAENGDYYYQESNRLIGIGAFPLRPDQEQHADDGSIIVNANSSEQALRRQIRHWLEDDNGRERLLEESIPQKGLEYSDEPVNKGTFYIASVDGHVNATKELVQNGQSDVFFSGYMSILSGVDFQKIKYFAPVDSHLVKGYYQVLSVEVMDMSEILAKEKAKATGQAKNYKGYDKPIRICLKLGKYTQLSSPFIYGLDSNASKGIAMTRKEFKEYCNRAKGNR